jgi:hypothetical protein
MGKGGDFEREISKAFTKWLTGVEKPYKFWRMPGSGGLATIHEENTNLSGDIRSLSRDSEFLTDCFSIECKTGYPKTDFWQHFKHIKTFDLKNFWRQCTEDALKSEKRPLLIYRKKGKQVIVGICKSDQTVLESIQGDLKALACISMRFPLAEFPEVVFYNFNEFFDLVTPVYIKQFIYGV